MSIGRLFLTFGLAAAIAGLFGSGNEIAKEHYELGIEHCRTAEQLLLDDTPAHIFGTTTAISSSPAPLGRSAPA